MASSPLLDCAVHGFVQDQSGIVLEDSTNVDVSGGSAPCPLCGLQSPYVSGHYSERDGRMSAVLRLTPRQVFRLQQTARWAEQQLASGLPDEEHAVRVLERTIETNAPEAKAWLNLVRDQFQRDPSGWVGALIALIALLVSMPDGGVSAEQVQQIVQETVEGVLREQAIHDAAVPSIQKEGAPPRATELPTPRTH